MDIFFTDNYEAAETYIENGGVVMEAFLNARNPFSLNDKNDVGLINDAIEEGELADEVHGVSPPIFNVSSNAWDDIVQGSGKLFKKYA